MILNVKENEKILIVAPHPDDEVIGCGGVISMYPKSCTVWLLTDGEKAYKGNDGGEAGYAARRRGEFVSAMEKAGVKEYKCFGIPQGKIEKNIGLLKKEDLSRYKYIFVPFRRDLHFDHSGAYRTVKKLCKGSVLIEYEVWSLFENPNVKLDISGIYEKKAELISGYVSQLCDLDYREMVLSLNRYRGLSRGCEYAEMYYSEAEEKRKRIKDIKKKIRLVFKR